MTRSSMGRVGTGGLEARPFARHSTASPLCFFENRGQGFPFLSSPLFAGLASKYFVETFPLTSGAECLTPNQVRFHTLGPQPTARQTGLQASRRLTCPGKLEKTQPKLGPIAHSTLRVWRSV